MADEKNPPDGEARTLVASPKANEAPTMDSPRKVDTEEDSGAIRKPGFRDRYVCWHFVERGEL